MTLVEFTDLQCPFCARAHRTLAALQRQYGPEKLRVVFKHNPLDFHEHARRAAEVASAVFRSGGAERFFSFLDLAFEHQAELSEAALGEWVRGAGLDPAQVLALSHTPEVASVVGGGIALAAKLGADGTPAFRINGATLAGAQPLEAFTRLIDRELGSAAELAKAGVPKSDIYAARVQANQSAESAAQRTADDDAQDLSVWRVPIAGAPSRGPRDALVTIVAFLDFECPFCRRAQNTLRELEADYPNQLRLVVRQNPLPFHARALPAANLALEARAERGDTGFFQAADLLFASESLDDDALLAIGKRLGLDERRVRRAIEKATHALEIQTDADIAADFGVQATPVFFINGLRMVGAQPKPAFAASIDAALKVARALVAQGTKPSQLFADIMSRAKEPDPPDAVRVPAPTADNPSRGPLNAPVVIQEFADFQCLFCARADPTLKELERDFPGKIRVVWRNLPLPFHEHARLGAAVALEARAERGDVAFWRVHDLLFRDQSSDSAFSPATLDGYVDELGLDRERFRRALHDAVHDAAIDRDVALAEAADIDGTPSFVINGYLVSGAQPLSAFKRVVRYALNHGPAKP